MTGNQVSIDTLALSDDGTFPNNRLPVVLYRQAILLEERDPAAAVEARFRAHGWGGLWRDGIFDYHHYHSTAHEVLGVARGSVRVQLGGPNGEEVELHAGDVVVLPAGTAHKNLGHSANYLIVGGYPPGQSPDMRYGEPGERPDADQAIAVVPLPETDPVRGDGGWLLKLWRDDETGGRDHSAPQFQ